MASLFGRMFDMRTGDEKKKDFEVYSKRIFPYGDEQKDKVFGLLEQLLPKHKQKYLRMHYIMIKQEMIAEEPLTFKEATKSLAKKTLVKLNKEQESYIEALMMIDLAMEDAINYPTIDEIKEQSKQYL